MPVKAAFIVPHPPLIIPQVGRGEEKKVSATIASYERAADMIAELRPETIVISSPHSVMYHDYFHISPGEGAEGSFAAFRAPQVTFSERYDTELVEEISRAAKKSGFPAGTMGERDPSLDHGTLVPLYFIRQKYRDCRIVRTGLSGLSLDEHFRYGQLIAQAAEKLGRSIVFVASGDLSHKLQKYGPYGFAPEGPEYDRQLIDVCRRGDLDALRRFDEELCDKAAECGHRSFVIMSGVLDGIRVRSEVFSHEDITGVGYGVCSFIPADEPDEYVALARQTIETYVRTGKKLSVPDSVTGELKNSRAGAFVSIHKNGDLRGCIGTILPTKKCLAAEIISNAISASTRDPRFPAITEEELPELEINVDVLSEPEPVSSLEELDVKRYGVIVSSGFRRGLLLPDLEGVDTVEQQVSIAMMKGGIRYGDDIELQRFEVIRHK